MLNHLSGCLQVNNWMIFIRCTSFFTLVITLNQISCSFQTWCWLKMKTRTVTTPLMKVSLNDTQARSTHQYFLMCFCLFVLKQTVFQVMSFKIYWYMCVYIVQYVQLWKHFNRLQIKIRGVSWCMMMFTSWYDICSKNPLLVCSMFKFKE